MNKRVIVVIAAAFVLTVAALNSDVIALILLAIGELAGLVLIGAFVFDWVLQGRAVEGSNDPLDEGRRSARKARIG